MESMIKPLGNKWLCFACNAMFDDPIIVLDDGIEGWHITLDDGKKYRPTCPKCGSTSVDPGYE